jgi:DNA (cytosine-5)-methyltransferase 1
VLNAANYGVPQTRERAVLIASSVRRVAPPEPTHAKVSEPDLFGPGLPQWVSMAEALGWGATDRVSPTVTAGGGKTGGAEPFPTKAREALLDAQERGAWLLRSGQSVAGEGRAERQMDEPAVAITGRADLCSWVLHTNRDQRADGSRQTADPHSAPAPALTSKSGGQWVLKRPATTVCATDRISPPGHRNRDAGGESQFSSPDTVRITVPEAAVLQSFPADHPFQGTKTKQFEQVGNAVPCLLAAHVASAASGVPFLQEALTRAA